MKNKVLYQHTDKCCLPSTIFSEQYYYLGIIKLPFMTDSLKPDLVFVMVGYL